MILMKNRKYDRCGGGRAKYIVNDYLKHIPTGEEWNIGDVVKIVYRGSIQETSPAVIEKESAIAVVDRAQDDQ